MRVSPCWLLLLLTAPVAAQDRPTAPLPNEAFLEFLGSFEQPKKDLLDLAFDTVEDEAKQTQAKQVSTDEEENKSHDTN